MTREKNIPEEKIKKALEKKLPRTGEHRSKPKNFSHGNTEYMQQNPHRDTDDKKKK
ncbi:hypothetical protein [Alkalibacterium olivapovliticus]|uniref:Uncharacterized protein n=1 Tax=Alkalibacterium olivapovliticus TaxID=99907 RepID=A0A2T0VTB9_9LACT|nr:hypothetical protein [Alkalibacterium olivapovliticus]PRY74354.1 hypothetical protein CLV38_1431 [Alkalibacterium olivapovliticus]